ncbi:IclR family transcriptional regulator [Cryobacterium levicorallinum]|uniref:IclR family transcriptional regulator n=2 Tax=Cryobacterium levicorallinum TaxID=995038 RepID=A0A1I2ZZ06_9MICO|nr:IclR family transcriptional regulator [Cryobacterium levicorallinum]TFB83137.1 IclR family transcriptional regulator [Cryobacterium levicorallinum]GEP26472.1 transcriptional regulator [Cryobacterium levicorallinum]SFH42895.1 transcriptional regulator, IclR family [Cryobacterium levicorallinum]
MILASFEASPAARSLSDISRASGLPQSTAHRLLGELEAWGAVQRDAQGRYQIGLRLWELGQHAGRKLRDVARPYLQDLFGLTQETVHFAIRDGSEVLYIDRVYGSRRVPQASRVGGRLPLHATAVGRAILAFEEDWVQGAVLDRPLAARTARTMTDTAELHRELGRIHARGFSLASEEVQLGSCSLAVPVFQSAGCIFGGLGIVLPISRMHQLERYLPALLGTAQRLQGGIAHLPANPSPARNAST